jgi:predicted amidohydrolase YtcJ
MVIYNGHILTADSPDPNNFSIAKAAAIYDGKFIVVGTDEEALATAGPNTKKIDLQGRTVIPGLVETHDHVYDYGVHFAPGGIKPGQEPPVPFTSKEDFLAQIRTIALRKKPGEWILTEPKGGDMGVIPQLHDGTVTRFDIDKVTPNNPFFMVWASENFSMVNTKVLDLLLKDHPDVLGVVRDKKKVPTGLLMRAATRVTEFELTPDPTPESLAPYYKEELEDIAAQGITTVSSKLYADELTGYEYLKANGELPIRFPYSIGAFASTVDPDGEFARLKGFQGGTGKHMWGVGDDMMWAIGVYLGNIDHVPSIAGSCVSKPYPREAKEFPLWRFQLFGPNGQCPLTDPNFNEREAFEAVAKYGFRSTAMHSGGDLGIDQYLDMVEELSKKYPDIVDRRWAIDHCRFVNDRQAERAKQLGIMFSCGPKYVYYGDKGDIGAFAVLFGVKTAEDVVVPLRRLIDDGIQPVMQLDQGDFHPMLSLQVAITRKDKNGKVWGPQQRITRQEALYMYTRWSPVYVLAEDKLGTIEPNKLADFVVLSRDYMTTPEDEIGRIDALMTVVGGKIVYTDSQFASSMGLPQVGYRGPRDKWIRGGPEEGKRAGGGSDL